MSSGNDVLAMIERMLGDTRGELDTVNARLERSSGQLEALRQSELGVYAVLARFRLREIESAEVATELDDTARQVKEVLAQRAEAQVALGKDLAAAQEGLAKLEQDRTAQHALVETAEKIVDAAEADAQSHLKVDPDYGAKLAAADASDKVADVTEAKSQAAQTDRVDKGKPYEGDPLFAYLWARGYGTSQYRALGFSRLLDRWVARVVDYEPLRRNYWMLSELPARFQEHAQRMRKAADDDVAAVREVELIAAKAAGVPEREAELGKAEGALASIDETIKQREAEIAALVEQRGKFASGVDEHSQRCTELLAETFRREKMKTLRERATQTQSPEDDAAIDQLAAIRAEMPRLEEEVARLSALHDTHRDRTGKLEEVRQRFKEQRYDAVTSEFVNGALIAALFTQLLSGTLGVPGLWDALSKQHRHRQLGADPGFGSGRFPRGPNPWGGGFGGGGGRGGGGFGGGGFGRGGGFGGGGFRKGGGF
jgi:chromosome segregation ATPase